MMMLLPLLALSSCQPNSTAGKPANGRVSEIVVDVRKTTPISPYIYGLCFPDWDKIGLPFTLARQGGNRMTAYNWENNASNAGNDWKNQNDDYLGASNEPGWTVRTFLEPTQSHHAACLITVPTEGYVAADKGPGGDVNLTPDYLNVRFTKSYAHKPSGKYQYPPDTNDKAVYQDEFVAWVRKIAKPSSPVWFALDNEPDIWAGTHSRICLTKPTYASIIANNIDFASGIKSVYPDSLIFGPVHYGYNGIRSFQDASDANGRFFTDVYLDELKAASTKAGKQLVDVYDFHYYPEAQGDGVRVTENKDLPGLYAARIQAPRSLWDPTYVETSWITDSNGHKPLQLIVDLQERIQKHYPGMKLGITEYNFGGNTHISGAIAQADALGVFGRYGIFAASNWGMSADDKAEIAGFRSFLNFDGKGGRFGNLGASVTGVDAATLSVYAALDSENPGRLTLVLINKSDSPLPESLQLEGLSPRTAKAYTIEGTSFESSVSTPAAIQDGNLVITLPAMSVTSVEVHR